MGITKRGKRVFTRPERTVLMLAPPGIGKSLHFKANLRAICQRNESDLPFLLLGDAADELYRDAAQLLSAAGYQIVKIDAVEPDGWSKYDILSILDPSPPKKYVFGRQLQALCELLVPDEPGSKQPHFVEFARLLLKCVITVNVKYEGNDKPIGELVAELVSEKKRAEMLKRAAKYDDDFITAALETMAKMQEKGSNEGMSMMTTALRKLESWSDAALKELTSYGPDMHGRYVRGWTFEEVFRREKPVAIFLRTGTQKMGGDLARIIYGNAINTVSMMLDRDKQPLSRQLEIIVDEAGLTGYCNAITHAYTRLRKAGVRVRMCFLGLNEFKHTYPDHDVIWAGSDLLVFGGSNETELNKVVSELLGEFTVHSRSESESDNGGSRGRSEQPRKLMKGDEIRRLEYDEALMLLDGIAVRGKKTWAMRKGKPVYL
jgi:type IV secretory pathway TraG/TraD family ATPase VirD4